MHNIRNKWATVELESNSFPRSSRLTESIQYQNVFSDNLRVSDQFWTILIQKRNSSLDNGPKLGLAVAKKRISRSVDRNRLKRLIRESFRMNKNILGQVNIVVMPRRCCTNAENQILHTSLERLWKKLVAQCKNR